MSPEMIGGIAAEQYFAPLAITLLSCLTHLIAYCDGGGIIAQCAVQASENKQCWDGNRVSATLIRANNPTRSRVWVS
ncbi:uncharacterized protein ARMOST_04179 [Armillaria ostoyae]|uniref:Uncharacterized protein n=1 Tax=Armillaria ostoyae TaxID=47428 RepID=A0A284QWM6_ARMOS|nr:uncharacterized protein ARMOST_04179 [Armillaria ostoyae]